jgi:hypothetical protein
MEKIDYLKSRGFSDQDIYRVWETLIDDDSDDDGDDRNNNSNNEENIHSNPETGVAVTQSPQQHLAARNRNTDVRYRGTAGAAYPTNSSTPPLSSLQVQPQGEIVDHETSQTVALLTVGGMLGLTAAAAVRWLNGGDFTLFPAATATDLGKTLQLRAHHSDGDAEDNDDDDADADSDSDIQSHSSNNSDENELREPEAAMSSRYDNVRVLSQQIQELTDLVKAQSESHQQLVKCINMQQTTQVTDQSMALLKRSQPLTEVKDLLLQLPSDNELVQKALEILNKHLVGELDQQQQQQQQYQPQYQNTSIPSIATYSNLQTTTQPQQETPSPITLLRQGIQRLALETDNIADLQSGCQVLYLYVIHLSSHPHVPRYRKIFTSNHSFQKVEKLPGAVELLLAVGFVQFKGYLEWRPENEQEALKTLQIASAALTILKRTSSLNEGSNNVQSMCSAALATLPTSRSPTPDAMLDDALTIMTPLPTVHSTPTTTTMATSDHLISPPNTKKHPDVHSSYSAPYVFPNTPDLKESSRQLDEDLVTTADDPNDPNGTKTRVVMEHTTLNDAAFRPIIKNTASQHD